MNCATRSSALVVIRRGDLWRGKQQRRAPGRVSAPALPSLPANAAPAGLSADYRRPVPLLSADDPLLHRPRRVLVAGTSGSGKTTLARGLAEVLAIPHIEIDALFHGPGWTPRESFVADVEAFSTTAEWVTEWQYSVVRNLLAARADLLIWLDLPRATVMRQVVGRTLRRRLRREVLWNGNVEPSLWSFFTDRDYIVRWAWSTHHKSALRVAELRKQRPELMITRLNSHAKARQWLAGPLLLATTRPPRVS